MRTSWILGGLICFAVGLFFTMTLIGVFVGFPLLVIGFIIFLLGFVIPKKTDKVEIHVHHHKKS